MIVRAQDGALGVHFGNTPPSGYSQVGLLPALYPEWLGDRSFSEVHRVRFPYAAGAMANGIASAELVITMAKAGFLAFFGAAGLSPDRVVKELDTLEAALGPMDEGRYAWGSNLIHSPNEPAIEARITELYLRRGVRRVSASAFMGLTENVVRYAYSGCFASPDGRVQRRNYVFAKVSRPEVAKHFLSPAPQEMIDALVAQGKLTAEEGRLAANLPVAEDYIIEADSGGHTDNQSLTALFPIILGMRDEIAAARGYERPIRVGAAGGLGEPSGIAAAFQLGAAFTLTGSVNQGCVESGLSVEGKKMLATAQLADVVMAPAADMFELGVDVQVLKRGTMFGVRAKKLYELYRGYGGLFEIPSAERVRVEKEMLHATFEDAWADTKAYWDARDPREVERAERDEKHKMALVFRAYLGQSSRWAIAGDRMRRMDYQIWCGPAMGAFNAWAAGSFLEAPENRSAVQVARNLLEGAAVITRAQQLRSFGVPMPAAAFHFRPRPLQERSS